MIKEIKALERKVEWMQNIASALSAANLEFGEMPDGVIRCDEYTIRAIFDGFREELSGISAGLYRLSLDVADKARPDAAVKGGRS
ncbi:MAG: hypothetical protein PHE55_00245 [Methylococcaceae bacterium]|nr:hypothetical protein [Methylococcaceae bacterium]